MQEPQIKLSLYLLKDLVLLFGYIVLFGGIGWLLHYPWSGILAAVTLFAALHMRALYLLYHWLKYSPKDQPPELLGIWGALVETIERLQKQEQKALQGLQSVISHAQASISALDEAIVLIEKNTLLEWWNPAAEKLLGLVIKDRGQNICNLIRSPEFLAYFNAPDSANDGVVIRSTVEKGGYLQFKLTPFGDSSKLLFVQNVTRIHQLEQMRKDFVANVSHELRTPLTVLYGYVEMIADSEDLDSRWQPAFAQMQQQTIRMNLLIQDLLHLSRLENNHVIDKPRIDVPTLLTRLTQDAEAINQGFEHKISLNLLSEKCLRGVEKELASAFMNLITNAIKYTPPQGKITLTWRDDGKQAIFSVTDTGIGIESQHLPRLTERFYRVDKGRSINTGGTGLGLAIVKHVLLQHAARLTVSSVPNQGSTFSCVFPWSEVVD